MTVTGFSFGLLFAKSMSFFEILNYFSFTKFLQARKKQNFQSQKSRQAQFSTMNVGKSEIPVDNRRPEQILGLNSNFTQEELKAAYQRESNRTHPDKWVNKPESIKKIMEAEQKQINAAYNKLKRGK